MRVWWQSIPREAVFWTLGLLGLALLDPDSGARLPLCLPHRLGWFCPGCGLGSSIRHLLRGNLAASWAAHPLGLPAALVLAWRIVDLCRATPRAIAVGTRRQTS